MQVKDMTERGMDNFQNHSEKKLLVFHVGTGEDKRL